MSKVILSFGSFVTAAFSMLFILSGIHASTWAQSEPLSSPSPAMTMGLLIRSAIPRVPRLGPKLNHVAIGASQEQILDGLNCANCSLPTAKLVYGGGAFSLEDTTFGPGHIQVELVGATANTLILLRLMGYLAQPSPTLQGSLPMFHAPKLQEAEVKSAITLTIATDNAER